MISARRIALLGIGFPLSPIMLAVMGLTAEEDTPTPPMFGFMDPLGGGGGRRPKAAPLVVPPLKRKPRQDVDADVPRIRRQNELILSLVMAAVTEEML